LLIGGCCNGGSVAAVMVVIVLAWREEINFAFSKSS
jgi:hypothetical protein